MIVLVSGGRGGSRKVQNISVSAPRSSPLGTFVVFFSWKKWWKQLWGVFLPVPRSLYESSMQVVPWKSEETNILQCNTFITAFKKEAQGTISCDVANTMKWVSSQSVCQYQQFHVKPRETDRFRVLRWFIPIDAFLSKETAAPHKLAIGLVYFKQFKPSWRISYLPTGIWSLVCRWRCRRTANHDKIRYRLCR